MHHQAIARVTDNGENRQEAPACKHTTLPNAWPRPILNKNQEFT